MLTRMNTVSMRRVRIQILNIQMNLYLLQKHLRKSNIYKVSLIQNWLFVGVNVGCYCSFQCKRGLWRVRLIQQQKHCIDCVYQLVHSD